MTIRTDCVIVGAGPCGLFQIFELGLLGMSAHVVEALPKVGGQCTELYPDKPIYDIPALPVCGAQELVDRLMEQIAPFDPQFHLDQLVTEVSRRDDGRFAVRTSAGTEFDAGTVVLAAGVGSFEPQRLKVEGAQRLSEQALFYRVRDPEQHAGQNLLILGGGDSALDWTLALVDSAASVTLMHRSNKFRAAPASVARMQALCGAGRMRLIIGNITSLSPEMGAPGRVTVTTTEKAQVTLTPDQLLVFFGLSPKLGPITQWGIDFERHQIPVDTERFQTSIPGIFAVGDINTYPGKKKLILSGFHEGALSAFAIKKHLYPDEKVHLQYTTTSSVMHQRLHVNPPKAEMVEVTPTG